MRLAGQHAIVTGGGTGIGAAIAAALAAEGARRQPDRARRPRAALGRAGGFVAADVTDRGPGRRRLRRRARARTGRSRSWSTMPARPIGAPFAKVDRRAAGAACSRSISTASSIAARRRWPTCWPPRRGRIVTIASHRRPAAAIAYAAAYIAAKHGAVGLMRALAAEYAGDEPHASTRSAPASPTPT